MNSENKSELLVSMLKQIVPDGDLDSIDVDDAEKSLEAVGGATMDSDLGMNMERASHGVQSVLEGDDLSEEDQFALEAIIMPKYRPAVDILNNGYRRPPSPWEHFGSGQPKKLIKKAIPSIGRIELPDHPSIPFGGTGFVVGKNLLMTNRHVAQIFADGLGNRHLSFKSGQTAGIDFIREVDSSESDFVRVEDILLIHPFWDMALLRVGNLKHDPLTLSVADPDDLVGDDVAVVGYPAQDPRNDLKLQSRIFRNEFNVKRLLPGKLRERTEVRSFGNLVQAAIHDASTLGGNSGSAVVHAGSGEVVALHFGGRYLKANYAVPTYELARDRHVVQFDLQFGSGGPAPTNQWDDAWRRAGVSESTSVPGVTLPDASLPDDASPPVTNQGGITGNQSKLTFTVPIEITVSLGTPVSAPLAIDVSGNVSGDVSGDGTGDGLMDVSESLKVPFMFGNLDSRKGYDPDFLDGNVRVPLLRLTPSGRKVVTKLDDGSSELKYHKFSVVMHKRRRLALFTAANVDWRPDRRKINGKKPTRSQLTGLKKGVSEKWVIDPRIATADQLPDAFYTKDRRAFHKGHLVRRDDVCWGRTFKEMRKANGDTYHTTNCSPQVPDFNSSMHGELNWGDLENMIQRQTKAEKAIVFSGPVFRKNDRFFDGIDSDGNRLRVKIPRKYWKMVVTQDDGELQAFGFVIKQDLSDVPFRAEEMTVPDKWRPSMVPIEDISTMLRGWVKLDCLQDHDQFEHSESVFNQAF